MAGRYKAYSEYKDSGVEWLGDIPRKWDLTRIKFLAGLNAPKSEVTKLPANTEVSFLPMEAVGEQGALDVSKTKTLGEVSSGYTYLAEGDVCIAKITPCFENGKGAIVRGVKNGIAFATTEVIPLRCNKECESKFLYYLLTSAPFNKQAEGSMYGAGGQKRVADSFVANYHFSSPSLPEQKQIAAFLDHETGKIDLLIEKQQALIALLKEKRQAVISHAVTKGLNPDARMKDSGVEWLGDVPEHWEVTKIKYIADLTPKKSEVEKDKSKTCSFIPMEKLKTDSLVLDETRQIVDVFDGYTYFKNEDVLIAKVTPCFENKNMVVARGLENGIGFGSSEIYALRAKLNYLNDFLCYRLQEGVFIELATAAMTGAGGLKRVPSDFLSNFSIALPPGNERTELVDYVEKFTAKFDALMDEAKSAIELMQERRTALISAAVTGKIDVRDWEPAESLKGETV